jgi:hypothetical protein
MDSLAECHGFSVEERHRALPDADLVWQLWQTLNRQHPKARIAEAVHALLAGPVLPPELAPSLIERLPETPGAYVFHGEGNRPLVVGAAANLKRHVLNYFRIDRATRRASEYAHRIANIVARDTRHLGAQLTRRCWIDSLCRRETASERPGVCAVVAGLVPCVAILPWNLRGGDSFDYFRRSEKRGTNSRPRHIVCAIALVSPVNPQCLSLAPLKTSRAASGDTQKQLLGGSKPCGRYAFPRGRIAAPSVQERSDIHVVTMAIPGNRVLQRFAGAENHACAFDPASVSPAPAHAHPAAGGRVRGWRSVSRR